MGRLEYALERHWPPNRVVVNCKECEKTILDTEKQQTNYLSANHLSSLIEVHSQKHREVSGHSSIDVGIDTNPAPVREIDCEVIVDGNEESLQSAERL
jgi:hypothetical protein